MDKRPYVKCDRCNTTQFVKLNAICFCRKCKAVLPAYVPPPPPPPLIDPYLPPADAKIVWGFELPRYGYEIGDLLILEAMRRMNGDKIKAAHLIGCGKTTLYRRLAVMQKKTPTE